MGTTMRPRLRIPLFAGAAVGVGALVAAAPAVIALLAPSLIAVMALVVCVRLLSASWGDAIDAQRVLRWTMAVFASHLLIGLVVTVLSTPFAFLRSDGATYHGGAILIVKHWTGGLPMPLLPGGKEGFYYTLAGLYWVFGAHAAAGLVVNAGATAALIPLLTDVTYRLFGATAAHRIAPLVLFMPGMVLWTSPLLKEGPIAFLVAVAIFCAVRIANHLTVASALGVAVAAALLFTFRGPMALVITGGLVIAIVASSRHLLTGLGLALVVASALAMLVLALGVGLSGYRSATDTDLERVNVVRQDLASANSGLQPGADVSTPRRALSYLPIGLANVVFAPFPWQVRSPVQALALLDAAVWWALLPSLIRGTRRARATAREYMLLVIPGALACVVLALAVGNFGTIVRERVQVIVVLLPLIAYGLSLRPSRTTASAIAVSGALSPQVVPSPA